ncbi:MAG: AMP-binding protein [Halobacteriovoraceae bacterium]|nr:AMP-binding protein [Halobacteriovoraceae bacterium]
MKKNSNSFLLKRFLYNRDRFGDKYAVESEEEKLTYSELDLLSDRFSHYLLEIGIRKNDIVGVCLQSNVSWIIILLGILKLGAVYFPIDPTYPLDRIMYMISDIEPKLVLSSDQFNKIFSELNISYLNIEKKLQLCRQRSLKSDEKIIRPHDIVSDDLAYVIYTSGSTGDPKGILVSHGNLCGIYDSRKDYYPRNFRGLISGGICFDASLLVIFYSLMSGGCLCLFNSQSMKNISTLKRFINDFHINFMVCIPSFYHAFLTDTGKINLQSVSLTGEKISKCLSLLHKKQAPKTQLLNEYGPSEYAIGSSIARIYKPETRTLEEISIGVPLLNTQIDILDESLRPVRTGEQGEICISGIGLSKGYFGKEKLTEKKFVNLRLGDGKSKRVYRTGDIGKKGNPLQYVGRIEQQIVLDGCHANLGEVESAFYQHPDVSNVVVFICPYFNKKEIVACFMADRSIPLDELYDFLEQRLVSQLVPSRLIRYNHFPTLPNGKIDRSKIIDSITSKRIFRELPRTVDSK